MAVPTLNQAIAAIETLSRLYNVPPERRGDDLQSLLADLDGAAELVKRLRHFVNVTGDQVMASTDSLASQLERRIAEALQRGEVFADVVHLGAFGTNGITASGAIYGVPTTLPLTHPARDWVQASDLYQVTRNGDLVGVLLLGPNNAGKRFFRRDSVVALTTRESRVQRETFKRQREDQERDRQEAERRREADLALQAQTLRARVDRLEAELAELRGEPAATQEHSGRLHAEPAASH